MKNVTIKAMIDNSNIPASLIRAVVRQFGGFDMFKQYAPDVTNHGINDGFCGFVYYTETCTFYAEHRKDIIQVAEDMSNDIYGNDELIGFVKSFNCLDADSSEIALTIYGNKSQHDTQVANALAWFAGEEVCRLYCDLIEQ